MKRKHFLLATAALVMAGCANEDFVGENVQNPLSGEQAIGFNMGTSATTRATKTDQEKLNNIFYVWGEKNENGSASAASAANTVFQNYTVKYGVTTAGSTTSNTKGWEYVGLTETVSSESLTPKTPAKQTIKYWDANADDYTFTAVSAKSTDIGTNVIIEKKTSGSSVYDKGYDITIKNLAAAADVYVADRVNIKKATLSTSNDENTYGGYVKFQFRNFQSKIRFGIFENVPGYKVIITKIVGKDANGDATYESTSGKQGFGVTSKFVAGTDAKYAVTYEPAVATGETQLVPENKVKFSLTSGTQVDYLNTGGTNWLSTKFTNWETSTTDNKFIGETAAAATYDKTATEDGAENTKAYTAILPNPGNTTDMTLNISFTLISEDTGETIEVNNKSVVVPHEYCQWKPNFAYTYLFKITEQSTNLYPITFDACVVEDETGKQETITTVTEPSWTVFATNTTKSAYKTIDNEFTASDVMYATLSDEGTPVKLTSTNSKLYTVKTTNATNYPITEGSVAGALKQVAAGKTVTTLNVQPVAVTTNPTYTAKVPTEDGNEITLDNGGEAMTWTADANTVYAVEYTYTDSNVEKKIYKVIKIGGADGSGATLTNQ